jgi:hypothetical protein
LAGRIHDADGVNKGVLSQKFVSLVLNGGAIKS